MVKFYRFAGVELAVDIPDQRMYEDDGQLAPFAVPSVTDPHWFRFSVVPELTPPTLPCVQSQPGLNIFRDGQQEERYISISSPKWQEAYIRVASRDKEHRVEVTAARYPGGIGIRTVLDAISVVHLTAQEGSAMFHCACVERRGKAILFTAPSGTGKSTQAELWKTLRGARIINGDRAAIRWDGAQMLAEGIPFCGSSTYCENGSLPIEAIVYLGQAPRTSIRRMGGYEAFSRLWEGVSVNTWEREDMENISDLIQRLAALIPIFYLPCTPDESAVTALEQALESR